jgi:hypothetical protein
MTSLTKQQTDELKARIDAAVERHVPQSSLNGHSRRRGFLAWAYITLLGASSPVAARMAGYADHTSALWAIRAVPRWAASDAGIRACMLELGVEIPGPAKRATARSTWTPADDAYLREVYGRVLVAQIAERLGRTVASVWRRARDLGIAKPRKMNRRCPGGRERLRAYLDSACSGRVDPYVAYQSTLNEQLI